MIIRFSTIELESYHINGDYVYLADARGPVAKAHKSTITGIADAIRGKCGCGRPARPGRSSCGRVTGECYLDFNEEAMVGLNLKERE